jgi:hypothetical protein
LPNRPLVYEGVDVSFFKGHLLQIKYRSRAILVSGIAQTTPPHVNTFVSLLFYNQQLLSLLFLRTSVTDIKAIDLLYKGRF